jgi:hypothetical protein
VPSEGSAQLFMACCAELAVDLVLLGNLMADNKKCAQM